MLIGLDSGWSDEGSSNSLASSIGRDESSPLGALRHDTGAGCGKAPPRHTLQGGLTLVSLLQSEQAPDFF